VTNYRCTVKGVFPNGRTWSTSRHISSTQSETALLTTWQNAWTAAWTDGAHGLETMYPIATKITEFLCTTLNPDMTDRSTSQVGVNIPGTNAGASLPSQISVVVSWRSARVGRHYRGHQSLAAPAEDQVVNDLLTGPGTIRVTAAMNAIKTAIQSDGSTIFGFNRLPLANGTPVGDIVTYTNVLTRDKIGTQDPRYTKEAATYT